MRRLTIKLSFPDNKAISKPPMRWLTKTPIKSKRLKFSKPLTINATAIIRLHYPT